MFEVAMFLIDVMTSYQYMETLEEIGMFALSCEI